MIPPLSVIAERFEPAQEFLTGLAGELARHYGLPCKIEAATDSLGVLAARVYLWRGKGWVEEGDI